MVGGGGRGRRGREGEGRRESDIHAKINFDTHTFPDPNFSTVSAQPAAAPGTVTLRACLGGIGLVGV